MLFMDDEIKKDYEKYKKMWYKKGKESKNYYDIKIRENFKIEE